MSITKDDLNKLIQLLPDNVLKNAKESLRSGEGIKLKDMLDGNIHRGALSIFDPAYDHGWFEIIRDTACI
jgi:hypothetical protein